MYTIDNLTLPPLLETIQLQIPLQGMMGIVAEPVIGIRFLRLLNGMDAPEGGTIRLDGQPLTQIDGFTLRRRVVLNPETPALIGETLRENLLAGLVVLGNSCSETEEIDMMERIELSHPRDGQAALLDRAEQQRLFLGRVLMMKPAVLLLDQPMSRQTPERGMRLLNMIAQWTASYGGCAICTSNDETQLTACNPVLQLPRIPARERYHTAYH